MERDEERRLIEAARDGDRDAFAALVRAHRDGVFRLCVSLLSNAAEAEDAAQDVFVKAYRSLGAFRGDASLATWLYRIASNRCMDLLRARRPQESWDELVERDGEKLAGLLREPSQAGALEAKDLIDRVLGQLPAEYRLVLTLRETQGLTYEEIAEATGDSLDSVKARLRRARAELEDKLRPFFPEISDTISDRLPSKEMRP